MKQNIWLVTGWHASIRSERSVVAWRDAQWSCERTTICYQCASTPRCVLRLHQAGEDHCKFVNSSHKDLRKYLGIHHVSVRANISAECCKLFDLLFFLITIQSKSIRIHFFLSSNSLLQSSRLYKYTYGLNYFWLNFHLARSRRCFVFHIQNLCKSVLASAC